MYLIKHEPTNQFICKVHEDCSILIFMNDRDFEPTTFKTIDQAKNEIEYHLIKDKEWTIVDLKGNKSSF